MLLCFVFFWEQSPTQLISYNHQDTNTSKRYLPYIMKTEKFSYKTRNKRAAADNPTVNDYVNGEKKNMIKRKFNRMINRHVTFLLGTVYVVF